YDLVGAVPALLVAVSGEERALHLVRIPAVGDPDAIYDIVGAPIAGQQVERMVIVQPVCGRRLLQLLRVVVLLADAVCEMPFENEAGYLDRFRGRRGLLRPSGVRGWRGRLRWPDHVRR